MQRHRETNRELLGASALGRQLAPASSAQAFLADRRREHFPDMWFEDLLPFRCVRPSVPADVIAIVDGPSIFRRTLGP